ncbi:MAG: AMP-binding protein [Muribaculaceae bacterium]
MGYGMTECAPLICYAPWYENREGACGRAVDGMTLRIDSADPQNVPGELWVKGDNVMMGYYRNDEATSAVMRDDWMNTGDVCVQDSDGFLYIIGRSKCMILGASGQNIYPEEIESKLSALPYVAECLVVQRDTRLVAIVYPDMEKMKTNHIMQHELTKIMKDNLNQLNAAIARYEQISEIELREVEFEKTPKKSIKRYLYH